MAQVGQVDRELQGENEEINGAEHGDQTQPNLHAPPQRDDGLQSSFGPDGRFKFNFPSPIVVFEGWRDEFCATRERGRVG